MNGVQRYCAEREVAMAGRLLMKDIKKMSEEELRKELYEIRAHRAGCGRKMRKKSTDKRISEHAKKKRKEENRQAIEEAEWV